ncbi:MAG: CHRD domain-containing protein [Dehalococcoidia bacterium]|nr:CHRD domain-containing protein [Dehalococcoidia bacterium]
MRGFSTFRLGILGLLLALGLAPMAAFWAMNATPVQAAPVVYTAILGNVENPPTGSGGAGKARVTIDIVAHKLRVEAQFTGLTGNTSAAHIHAPAIPPANVGVATQTPSFSGFPLGVTAGAMDQTFDTTLASSFSAAFLAANGGTA